MRILFFGDSITHGFFDSKGGWAQRLINSYHMESYRNQESGGRWVECFNLGISGDTAKGLVTRLDSEVRARQLYPDECLIVIAIGINDTAHRLGKAVNSLQKYQTTIDHLYHSALTHSDKILFVGLSSVDDTICNPWHYSANDFCFSNDRIRIFNDELQRYCRQYSVPFVKVFEVFKSHGSEKKLLADGLHPNDPGHQLIAALVQPELEKLLAA